MKKLLFAFLIIAASPAWAEWSKIFETTGETYDGTVYIDYTSLRKNGHLVKAWLLTDFKKKHSGSSSQVNIDEFDCREERKRTLSTYFFSGQMGLGGPIEEQTKPEEWKYLLPMSWSIHIRQLVCHDWLKLKLNDALYFEPDLNDLYFDPVTIRKNRQFATFWTLLDGIQGDKYGSLSVRSQNEYDCEGKRMRIIAMSGHSDLMASGDILFFGKGDKKWSPIDLSHTALEYVCK